ncbi:hypothetical protein AZE42_02572 [Rhizopogon vesiculosus]|uniref:Copper transport protein n=1 Tax=Rhizopogon vesiculosus TaxID=180088 RepID=A0A1J8PJK7_9AGAM|nr:hypothetical protein AZE42_02572 [Rhizopogon vesiculosus]
MATMMMTPWLHFSGEDYFIFKTWQPRSNGAIAGACIALVAFCILERWIAALRRQWEIYWGSRAHALMMRDQRFPSDGQHVGDTAADAIDPDKIEETSPSYQATSEAVRSRPRSVPPFIPMHDIPRGILHGIQVLFSYILMLVIMTFNASYVISIVLGLAIGEVLFGRIGRLH